MKPGDKLLRQWRFSKARPHVRGSLLDVGCHDGSFLRSIESPRRIGVDILVPQTKNDVCMKQTNLEHFTVEESFETITCLATYEHLSVSERASFWLLVHKHLVAEGQLIMTVPHRWVDHILKACKFIGLLRGMEDQQHTDVNADDLIKEAYRHKLTLERFERFQFGLNRLFIFRRPV